LWWHSRPGCDSRCTGESPVPPTHVPPRRRRLPKLHQPRPGPRPHVLDEVLLHPLQRRPSLAEPRHLRLRLKLPHHLHHLRVDIRPPHPRRDLQPPQMGPVNPQLEGQELHNPLSLVRNPWTPRFVERQPRCNHSRMKWALLKNQFPPPSYCCECVPPPRTHQMETTGSQCSASQWRTPCCGPRIEWQALHSSRYTPPLDRSGTAY